MEYNVETKKYDFEKDGLENVLNETAKKLSRPRFLLIHEDDKVGFYRFSGNNLWNSKYIKELRFFSQQGELYLWRQQEMIFGGRWREENTTIEEDHVYEDHHLIWGNDITQQVDITILEEKGQGMSICFPFIIRKDQLPLKYQVKNYYRFDKNGLLYFYDARLVAVMDCKGKILQEEGTSHG